MKGSAQNKKSTNTFAQYDPQTDRSFYEVFKRADGLMYERKMQLKRMGASVRD